MLSNVANFTPWLDDDSSCSLVLVSLEEQRLWIVTVAHENRSLVIGNGLKRTMDLDAEVSLRNIW